MKKKIAILGSTGSIGESTLKIIQRDKKNFEINLLTTNKNINRVFKQAKEFKVKNIIISDLNAYRKAKIRFKKSKINFYNNYDNLNKILKFKNDLVMSSITGLNGLYPTLKLIKYTKKILIANKESIICGWNLINKELKKNKTKFIPVDSEHFSIWSLLHNYDSTNVEKIYITASGGPFLKLPKKKFLNVSIKKALNHPNWKMGKKITIDSATLMNKVFEVIEARNIFDLDYKKISILTHPKSYLHAIVKFNDGMTKLIAHDTTMEIPIFNTLYDNNLKSIKTEKLNLKNLNDLELSKIDIKKFPLIKILKKLPNENSLFETVLVSANDELVKLFLNKDISYLDITKIMIKLISLKELQKYKKIKPRSTDDIIKLNEYVRLKINSKHIYLNQK